MDETTLFTLASLLAFIKSIYARAPARTATEIRAAFERFAVSEQRIKGDLRALTITQLQPLERPLFAGKRKSELVSMAWEHLIDDFAWLTVGEAQFLTKTHDLWSAAGRDELADTRARLAQLTDESLNVYLDARESRQAKRKAELLAISQAARVLVQPA